MKAIDSHCHIFNIVSVGLRALLEQLHESSELITSNKEARAVTTSAKAAAHQSIIDKLRKIVELIKIFSGDSVKILTLLDNHYKGDYQLFPLMFDGDFLLDTANEDENNQIKDITSNIRQHLAEDKTRRLSANALVDPKKFLSQNENDILLDLLKSIDYEIDASKGEKDGFSIQYNAIVSIKKNPKFQHKVYPFLGVDPRRKDIKTYLKQVGKDQLFAGIKIYAPNGFSPTDPLLDDVFKYCCTNHIPVIAHCSAGGFATPAMHIDINGYVLLPQKTQPELWQGEMTFKKSITDGFGVMVSERAQMLNHPKVWRKLLETHKDLMLVLAHFGEGDDEWRNEICAMMHDFDNLYTDISCMSDVDNLKKVKAIFDNPEHVKLKGRILYGSDYFLDMFFNDSFEEYTERIKGVFNNGSYEQIAVVNPQHFMNKWYS